MIKTALSLTMENDLIGCEAVAHSIIILSGSEGDEDYMNERGQPRFGH